MQIRKWNLYCEVIEKNQQEDCGKEEIDGVEKAWDGSEINGKEQESPTVNAEWKLGEDQV